jgi:hypothetical protein
VSSGVLVFPRRIAPALRSRVTTVASWSGTKAFRPGVPPLEIRPRGVERILDRHGHPVEGSFHFTAAHRQVGGLRRFPRTLGIDLHYGIEPGVDLLDASETSVHDLSDDTSRRLIRSASSRTVAR